MKLAIVVFMAVVIGVGFGMYLERTYLRPRRATRRVRKYLATWPD